MNEETKETKPFVINPDDVAAGRIYICRNGARVKLAPMELINPPFRYVVKEVVEHADIFEPSVAYTYTNEGDWLVHLVHDNDIICLETLAEPEVKPLPKLGRPKGKGISAAAMATRKDNWTLHTLRAMYANAINIKDKDKDLLSPCVIDELGTAINKLVFKLHPELERFIAPEDVIINHREWARDKNWVWYSVLVPKEVKINCL